MNGLHRKVSRLFGNRGKLLVVAMDHPQYIGPISGLEEPRRFIKQLGCAPLDGFVLTVGMARLLNSDISCERQLILRADISGTRFSKNPFKEMNFLSPETVLGLGADGVIMMLPLGAEDERTMGSVALAIEKYHRFSIPVIIEIVCEPILEMVEVGARIAAEIGADVVKVPFVTAIEQVVANCPIPVVLAGGTKESGFLQMAKHAASKGVKGFIVGRNVFQDPDPVKMLIQLDRLLRS